MRASSPPRLPTTSRLSRRLRRCAVRSPPGLAQGRLRSESARGVDGKPLRGGAASRTRDATSPPAHRGRPLLHSHSRPSQAHGVAATDENQTLKATLRHTSEGRRMGTHRHTRWQTPRALGGESEPPLRHAAPTVRATQKTTTTTTRRCAPSCVPSRARAADDDGRVAMDDGVAAGAASSRSGDNDDGGSNKGDWQRTQLRCADAARRRSPSTRTRACAVCCGAAPTTTPTSC